MDTNAATHAASNLPSTTDSWVYLFSRFTHEAMLFEVLAILLGVFGYAVFYLIRKRKYGVAGKEVPANLMKVYLAQLVGDATEMRTQLFGLLGQGEATASLFAGLQNTADRIASAAPAAAGAVAAGAPIPAPAADPKAAERMKELEKKLAEQANALDAVLNEKMRLEEDLANARVDSKSPGAAPTGGANKDNGLAERVKQLESQLAEYAIIEDDLANLKRLQKENKALKQQLAEGGMVPSAPRAEPVPEAPKPAPARNAFEPMTKTAAAVDPAAHEEKAEADFEALVDVVEKNLADTASAAPVAETAEQKADEKSEEQLQADFEKMLNS
jgi:hypothetical protein